MGFIDFFLCLLLAIALFTNMYTVIIPLDITFYSIIESEHPEDPPVFVGGTSLPLAEEWKKQRIRASVMSAPLYLHLRNHSKGIDGFEMKELEKGFFSNWSEVRERQKHWKSTLQPTFCFEEKTPDYGNTIIYSVTNLKNGSVCYVGYSTNPIETVKEWAVVEALDSARSKIAVLMRAVGVESFGFEVLESYPCRSSREATARKMEWITRLSPVCNECTGRQSGIYWNGKRKRGGGGEDIQ